MAEIQTSIGGLDDTIATLRGDIRTLGFEIDTKNEYIEGIERTTLGL
jgi:hypothetical protein